MTQNFLCFLLLISTITNSQETTYYHINYKGDSVKLLTISNPTVCDCIKKDYRNIDQKKICAKKFDYDFMTEKDQRDFDAKKEICKNPSVCDCAKANLFNTGLIKACDNKYRLKWVTVSEKKALLSRMHECTDDDLSYPKLIAKSMHQTEICDCINLSDKNYDLKKKCQSLFFDENTKTLEEIETNTALLQKCIEDKNFSIDPTICECKKYAKNDNDFYDACSEKFDTISMSVSELQDYRAATILCSELEFYRHLNTLIDSLNSNPTLTKKSTNEQQLMDPEKVERFDETNNWIELNEIKYEQRVRQLILNTAKFQICDCIHLTNPSESRIEACVNYFKLNILSLKDLSTLKNIAQHCSNQVEIETVCDCVSAKENTLSPIDKENCKKLIAPLSTSDLIKFMNGEKKCD
ncbi:MAG: hypothetical protein HOK65_06505 [Crocinitomicaceae bacterium]|jgi:hypothetical protein|nr:hypothetical protein [Crocinitomicaceae bacterium]